MNNEEFLATVHMRGNGGRGKYVKIIAEGIENGARTSFSRRRRDVYTYDCPSCGSATRFNVGRTIRDVSGELIKICPKCYNLGPTVVFANINRRAEQ